MRGLFINNKKAKDSIYESGYMVYQCLKLSDKYILDYCEVDIENREIKAGYDFYFFNYHPVTMGWLQTRHLKKELGYVITMILEVAPGDAFIMCPENDFNFYCALDPTIKPSKKLYAFSRPLENIKFDLPIIENAIPVIGSFGFSTKGKGFHHVVEAVNKEFEKAIVRINIPYGDFVADSKAYAIKLGELCVEKAKPGIEVRITHDFMEKNELIKWCAENTLNCFLYDRQIQGLAATTDQAITSGRPLSISDNYTFRHITKYLPPYPRFSLKDSINKSIPIVEQMKRDWSPENFCAKFEKILLNHSFLIPGKGIPGNYILPLKKNTLNEFVRRNTKRLKRILSGRNIKNIPLIFKKKGNDVI